MKFVFIGVIRNEHKKVERYRVLNTDNNEFVDMDKVSVLAMAKKNYIKGLDVSNGNIVGKPINIDNYSDVTNSYTTDNVPIIILNKIVYYDKVVAYRVCNCFGYVYNLTKDMTVGYARRFGLINGRIKEGKDGSQIEAVENDFEPIYWATGEHKELKITNKDFKFRAGKTEDEEVSYEIESAYGKLDGYYDKLSKYFWVRHIEVYGEHRHMKVASQLYKLMEDRIRHDHQVNEIRLGVNGVEDILLWRALGFKVKEYMHDSIELPESAIMTKSLSSKLIY